VTSLTAAVPGAFGLATVAEVTEGIHLGNIVYGDLGLLAPLVFEHADRGDTIAGQLVERQGTEIAIMAISCLERLDLLGREIPVVLGGGILANRHERLWAALESELLARAPKAIITHVTASPIVGAALLALESAGAGGEALERAQSELTGS
jgi:N-acetylglucosamine kinase-like BadF-type ATPase